MLLLSEIPIFFLPRLTGLEPLEALAREFDAVKNPLEDWLLQRTETFSSLPLVEVAVEELEREKREMEELGREVEGRKGEVERLEELAAKFEMETEVHITYCMCVSLYRCRMVVTSCADVLRFSLMQTIGVGSCLSLGGTKQEWLYQMPVYLRASCAPLVPTPTVHVYLTSPPSLSLSLSLSPSLRFHLSVSSLSRVWPIAMLVDSRNKAVSRTTSTPLGKREIPVLSLRPPSSCRLTPFRLAPPFPCIGTEEWKHESVA